MLPHILVMSVSVLEFIWRIDEEWQSGILSETTVSDIPYGVGYASLQVVSSNPCICSASAGTLRYPNELSWLR